MDFPSADHRTQDTRGGAGEQKLLGARALGLEGSERKGACVGLRTIVSRLARSRPALLTLIMLVGAVLRFWGIFHGLADGLIIHADAHLAVHSAWHLHLGGPFHLASFGAAHGVLSWLALEAAELVARMAGYPLEWTFALISSVLGILTAVMGTLTILAVYLLGIRAFGHRVGLLAAALVAVSPLHTFHSHYPYRDVPMILVLTLTLAGCVTLAARPSLLTGVGVALGAGLTAALKPAGMVVAASMAVALGLAWRRRRTVWMALAALGLVLVALAGLGVFLGGRSPSPLTDRWEVVVSFLTYHGPTPVRGAPYAFGLLVDWLGWPAALAWGLGFGVALWRRRPADLILVAFLVPAFLAAAAIPWLDERFLVYLVPPASVLVARLLVGLADRAAGRPLARAAVGLLVLALLAADLGRSAWQGVLLSLPDTRVLAGRWFEAHIPRATRVAMEGYFPVGVNEWPHVSFFEPRNPLPDALAAADVLVTSTLEHIRVLERPQKYAPALGTFFRALSQERAPMRTFSLASRGFAHSDIAVYATRPPRVAEAPVLLLPRPYDHTWNRGVAFLQPGPYDRDDRTVLLGGAQDHGATLVGPAAPAAVDEVAVFVANGPEPSRIRVQVGWRTRQRLLEPGAWHVFHFRPRWWWPGHPALYRFRAGLLSEGRSALVQVRAGPREIGEAYATWGHWAAAIPYLERAASGRRGDAEILLLLGTAYRQLGRSEDARRVAARLETEASDYRTTVAQLAQATERAEAWTQSFERLTGLDRALLTAALTRDVRIEAILAQGRLAGDPEVPGGVSAVFERGVDAPGLVVNGPRGPRPLLYLAPGAYQARFTLRGGPAGPGGESAVLRVFGERRLLAARPVTSGELGDGRRVAEVVVPFVQDGPPTPVAVQVEATGRGSFRINRVRIEPDLPEAFRQRRRSLDALAG